MARYLGTLGGRLKIASIRRQVVAISQRHNEHGFDSPTTHKLVREVVTGIARTHGSAQTQKAAVTTDILGTLLKALDRESLDTLGHASLSTTDLYLSSAPTDGSSLYLRFRRTTMSKITGVVTQQLTLLRGYDGEVFRVGLLHPVLSQCVERR